MLNLDVNVTWGHGRNWVGSERRGNYCSSLEGHMQIRLGSLAHQMRETVCTFMKIITGAYCALLGLLSKSSVVGKNAAKALFLPCSPIRSIKIA